MDEARSLILVEGLSDKIAVENVARRLQRDLRAERIAVVSLGGAHGFARSLADLSRQHPDVRRTGLYDEGEEHVIGRALAGLDSGETLSREEIERAGFFACSRDLEDELIRAIGAEGVQACFAAHGELRSFQVLQGEPAWRGKPIGDQLRRFLGSGATRKHRYARLLTDVVGLDSIPSPLVRVLEAARPDADRQV